MKFELSKNEQRQLEQAVKTNKFSKYFEAKKEMSFNIGDVLIKSVKRWSGGSKDNWQVETVNSDNPMPQRYVYIYEDEYGVGFIKQLRVSDAKLGKELICLADLDFNNTRLQVDPEFAEAVLLDADFDIKKLHKQSLEARKIISGMNRKIGVKAKTIKDLNDFFSKLKPGDKFYKSSDYTAKYVTEYKVKSTKTATVDKLNQSNEWDWRRFKEKNKQGVNDTFGTYVELDRKQSYGDNFMATWEFAEYVLYTTAPAQQEKSKE